MGFSDWVVQKAFEKTDKNRQKIDWPRTGNCPLFTLLFSVIYLSVKLRWRMAFFSIIHMFITVPFPRFPVHYAAGMRAGDRQCSRKRGQPLKKT